MRVLLVDDEPDILAALELCWQSDDIHITTAPNARAAIACLEDAHPDLIITDYRMPAMDGLAMLEHIQAEHRGIPAVLMTAYTDEAIRDRARAARVALFLEKPFDPEVAWTRIIEALSKR